MNRSRRRARLGLTLLEVLVAGFVMSLIVSALVTFVSGVNRAMTQQVTESALSDSARAAMDEMLMNLRGANGVVAARTLNGAVYSTSGEDLVFLAPSYNPASSQVVLTSLSDAVAYDFDPDAKVIRETIVPGSGSIRPVRAQQIIARNVREVAYTFSVREQFTAGGTGSQTFTLKAAPAAKPLVLVNGIGTDCTFNAQARTVTAEIPVRGAKVQVMYGIQPTDSAALPSVTQVDVSVTFEGTDSRQRTYTFILPGSARLRNMRL